MRYKLWALPTWLLTKVMSFPEGHPWKGRRITLSKWAAGRTDLCKQYDSVFWASFLFILSMATIGISQ
jgi:hypothetical protein